MPGNYHSSSKIYFKKNSAGKFLGSILLALASTNIFASDSKGTFSFALENDLFSSGTDQHYTSGAEFSYISDTYMPHWFKKTLSLLPFQKLNDETRFSWSLAQHIFTPVNIEEKALITDDRPYAGWLSMSLGLVTEEIQDNYRYVEALEVIIGVVGPKSKAEYIQELVHERIDSTTPEGWDNQLHDEYTVDLRYRRSWLMPIINDNFDFLPSYGFTAGSSQRLVNFGTTIRVGSGLFSDFGPPLIRPSASGAHYFKPNQPFYWYFFVGAHGRYVAYNIFLDGNSDGNSHSVDKREWVADIQAGLILGAGDWRLSITNIFRTREFDTQTEPDEFGSIALSYRF